MQITLDLKKRTFDHKQRAATFKRLNKRSQEVTDIKGAPTIIALARPHIMNMV